MKEGAEVPAGFRHRAGVPRPGGARGLAVLGALLLGLWASVPAFAQGVVTRPGDRASAQLDQRLWVRALFGLTILGTLGVLGWRLRAWQRGNERSRDALVQSEALLKHSLWGSRGELWDADIRTGSLVRRNRLEHLEATRSASVDSLEAYTPYVHSDDLVRFRETLGACIRGHSELFECSYRSPDIHGAWRWLLSRGRVFSRDTHGRALRMVGTTFDITELRVSEEALRLSEERLKLALWGSGDELWDIDLSTGNIKRENALPQTALPTAVEFRRLLEYLDVVHPDDRLQLRETLLSHLKGDVDHFECSYRVRTNDGGWLWILGKGRVVGRSSAGKALRLVGTNRDISGLKSAEEQLRRLNDELELRVERRTHALAQANLELTTTLEQLTRAQLQLVESEKLAALGSLVAGVAHEINTPLGVGVTAASHLQLETQTLIRALSELKMTRGDLDRYLEQARLSSDLILRNLERASHLVRSFKQVAVDQSSEQRRQFALREYLSEILTSLYPRMKKSRGRVEIDCPDAVIMDTYPGALYQIIVNLVINSLVHAFDPERGGRIDIRVNCLGDDAVAIDFSDDGAGMDAATVKRIFEPYFTTRRSTGGSGLGLHIVYNLTTQLLGGSVSCDSTPGKGTHFLLTLPRIAPGAPGHSTAGVPA